MSQTNACRIVVIASNLQRLTKIISLLLLQHKDEDNHSRKEDADSYPLLQYLPCVAQFDRYRHEKQWISYLVHVEYHPELLVAHNESSSSSSSIASVALLPTSLLELANNHQGSNTNQEESDTDLPTISDLVIGNGIDSDICTQHIQSYFQTLFSMVDPIPCHGLKPTAPYTTMSEKLQAFQALSWDEKETVTQKGTMGPGKMVHLIRLVGQKRIEEWRDRLERHRQALEAEKQRHEQHAIQKEEEEQQQQQQEEHIIDPNKIRYACRICRNILFGEDDLIEHNADTTTTTTKHCQSYFLHQSLPWMKPTASNDQHRSSSNNTTNLDNDLRETLGRLTCQKCRAKLGTWNWSGTPCSCGAWVVPAFQFPKSKIDAIPPVTTSAVLERVEQLAIELSR